MVTMAISIGTNQHKVCRCNRQYACVCPAINMAKELANQIVKGRIGLSLASFSLYSERGERLVYNQEK